MNTYELLTNLELVTDMHREIRRQAIVDVLSQSPDGAVSVTDLAERFCVSAMTIRRDLTWLVAQGTAKRVHGGALLVRQSPIEKPFSDRAVDFGDEKQAIGQAAAQLVDDGDVVILDAGTTTLQVARCLAGKQDLTVITNALPVAQALAGNDEIAVIVLGGILKPEELCTVGPMVTRELGRLSADKVFLSTTGFDLHKGLTDPDIHEAEVKESMIGAADRVILVADSTKWQHNALARIAPAGALHIWITDAGLPQQTADDLADAGITVIQA